MGRLRHLEEEAGQPAGRRLESLRRMGRIRHFEEEAGKLTETGKIPGALHLYVGEEAVAAGVMVLSATTTRSRRHTAALGGRDGYLKLVADTTTGEIVGAHIVGPDAAEVIAVAALAMH